MSALSSILGQISNANAYEQVVYNDGVTSLTTSLVAKDIDNITFKKYRTVIQENGRYYYEDTYDTNKTEAPAANIETTTDAEGKSIKYDKTTGQAYAATYNYENNALEWNVSDTRLEKGWVYTCRFTVWPSQAAYDLVADLNNGVRTWNSLTAAEKASVYDASGNGTGPFSLKTNTEGTQISYNEIKSTTSNKLPDKVTSTGSGSSISYSYNGHLMTKQEDGSYVYVDGNTTCTLTVVTDSATGGTTYTLIESTPGTSTVTNPDPVALETGTMKVRKVWDDSINDRNESNGVYLYLWRDGVMVTPPKAGYTNNRFELPINDAWVDTVSVAPGLMTVTTVNEQQVIDVKEAGHNYTLTEEIPQAIAGEYNDYSYEFSSQTVRPMEVNGHLKYLILVDEPYSTAPSGATTYTIPDITVNGKTIKGGTYYEASGADDATLKAENHKTSELDITKVIDSTLSDKTADELDQETFTYTVTLTSPSGSKDHGVKLWIYTPVESGGFKLPEYNDLRVTGTSSEVTFTNNTATVEVTINRTQIARFSNLPTGTTYSIKEIKANGNALADEGYVITGIGQGTSARPAPAATTSDTATGTIAMTNTRYYNNFRNALTSVDAELKVHKELDGYEWKEGDSYEFTLSAANGVPMPKTTTTTVTSSNADNKTSSFGKIRFTEAGTYTYTVTETNAGQTINGIEYGAAKQVTVTVTKGTDGFLKVTNISESYVAATDTTPASGTVTITNKWAITEASAIKAWKNADGSTTAPKDATVTFTLYADGVLLDPSVTVTLTGEAKTAPEGITPVGYESEAWKATFLNLPKFKTTDNGTKEIVYTIDETTTYSGYKKVVVKAEDGTETPPVASGGTITNEQIVYKVRFVKKDMKTTVLPGAVFKITVGDTEYTMTSNKNGILETTVGETTVTDLPLAVSTSAYTLKENTPPNGYLPLNSDISVLVKEDGVTYTYEFSPDTVTTETVDGETVYIVTIRNTAGQELPMTGGEGTWKYTVAGAILIFTGLCFGCALRRRERRFDF